MTEETYNQLAIECTGVVNIVEVLDKEGQPLNSFMGMQIEIDNSVNKFKIM